MLVVSIFFIAALLTGTICLIFKYAFFRYFNTKDSDRNESFVIYGTYSVMQTISHRVFLLTQAGIGGLVILQAPASSKEYFYSNTFLTLKVNMKTIRNTMKNIVKRLLSNFKCLCL